MSILIIIVCVFAWFMYEIHRAPLLNDKELEDYENDEDALF